MGFKGIILSGWGKKNTLLVGGLGEVFTTQHPHPPLGETAFVEPLRQYFTDDGEADGSNVMKVDGSSTTERFFIKAISDKDIYVRYLSALIGDGGSPSLNNFGALGALTNGVKWTWDTLSGGEYELHEGIKTNLEFIRIGGATGAIGTGTDAYLADVSGGGSEKSYLPSIDLSQIFGTPWGLKLAKGTTDAISFTVRDDLTALTTFNIQAFGIRV